ncbi:ENDD1 protein, partial [Grantiella picta]|nr:ENDD1 protein [Grantiella picta]
MLWLLLLQVLASCLWLGHSKVVKSFETSCPRFFYNNTTPDKLDPKNPARICQSYNNSNYFATLYDKDLRIPVYSAYIYQPLQGRPNVSLWFVEPQLVNQSYPKDMETESFLKNNYKISLDKIGQSQAINQDYNGTGLDRGHLSPVSHHNTNISKLATFTLTNAVPQDLTLNRGAWKVFETKTMTNNAKGCNTTYVIVGAVPGNTFIANGRVNKPSHLWSAACCVVGQNATKTWAAIAKNNNSKVQNITITLKDLESNLTQLYRRGNVSLFHSNCCR